MRFTKIAIKADAVELIWTKVDEHGATITTNMSSPEKPAPELPAALQAFKDFVFDLIEAPSTWRDEVRVTSLSISEEKTGKARGLIVTAVKPVEKASGRLLVLNTPHMRQGGDNSTSEHVLTDDIMSLVAQAEAAATAFVKGDRAQLDAFPADASAVDTSDKGDQVGARRERKKRVAKEVGTPNEVMNPDKTAAPTDDQLRAILLAAGRDVPVDAIATWTSTERDTAQRWAAAKADVKSGVARKLDDLIEPDHVQRSATPALDDNWTDPKGPKKLSDEAVVEIVASTEKAD